VIEHVLFQLPHAKLVTGFTFLVQSMS